MNVTNFSLYQICPMEARRKTICNNNDDSKAGHWVSNIRDDGGPLEGGSSYRIKWEPDYTSPNKNMMFASLKVNTVLCMLVFVHLLPCSTSIKIITIICFAY